MSFENWTIEDLIARCTDFDEMTLEMDREEFAALRRKITELKQAGNSPVIPGAQQRVAGAVELLQKAAPAMLADNSGPDGPLAGRLKSPVIPEGYVMVPKVPSQAHLNSIAMRYRHDFYLLNDAQKDSALATARQMYEECSGQGFYNLPAGPKEAK